MAVRLQVSCSFRVRNNARIQEFAKGTAALHQWIEQSKEKLAEAEQTKATLETKVATLTSSIAEIQKSITALETPKDPEIVVVNDSNETEDPKVPKSREERLQELYSRLGLNHLSADKLKYLLVKTLVHGMSYNPSPLKRLQEDMLEVDKDATVSEDCKMEELREVIMMEALAPSQKELNRLKEELKRLEQEKADAEKELGVFDVEYFFGGQNEFFMMKGQCYNHMVFGVLSDS